MPNPDPWKAREQRRINAAHRATDDPERLARSLRIVRAALDRGLIGPEDLMPLPQSGDLINA